MEEHEDAATEKPMLKTDVTQNKSVRIESPVLKAKKRAVYLNLFVLCSVWFFIFTPYMALEVLQSSLNPHAGLGVTAISVLYTTKILSSFFGPLIIHKLTAKWTLVIGWVCHTLFVAANYYPTWLTLVTAGALVGMSIGPIWICNGVYITTLASEMAELKGNNKQQRGKELSKFYGIFGLIPPLTGIIGNFVSSFILKTFNTESQYQSNMTFYEFSDFNNSVELQCGAKYCPYEYDKYLEADINKSIAEDALPDPKAVYILLTIYLAMSVFGTVLTAAFLRNVQEKKNDDTFVQNVVKNVKAFVDRRLLLLVPVFFFMFMRRATVNASFTKVNVRVNAPKLYFM